MAKNKEDKDNYKRYTDLDTIIEDGLYSTNGIILSGIGIVEGIKDRSTVQGFLAGLIIGGGIGGVVSHYFTKIEANYVKKGFSYIDDKIFKRRFKKGLDKELKEEGYKHPKNGTMGSILGAGLGVYTLTQYMKKRLRPY